MNFLRILIFFFFYYLLNYFGDFVLGPQKIGGYLHFFLNGVKRTF